jgi:hypothetical protein
VKTYYESTEEEEEDSRRFRALKNSNYVVG